MREIYHTHVCTHAHTQTTKVRQRFMVKPSTAHIVCMKAIPGSVEESSEFTDSDLVDKGTSWVADAFSSNRKTTPTILPPVFTSTTYIM